MSSSKLARDLSTVSRPPRTYLFAPGSSDKLLARVFGAGAEAVVLDLEDGVAELQKDVARLRVADAVRALPVEAPPTFVRINAVSSSHWARDVEASVACRLHGVRIPKVESADQVHKVAEAVAAAEEREGIVVGTMTLDCTIETALGVAACEEIARSHPRVRALVFGAADLANDIRARVSETGVELLYARSRLVIASRVARIVGPVDGAYPNVRDVEGLGVAARHAAALGFSGKSAIHPSQLEVIERAFTPDDQEMDSAVRALQAYEEALGAGRGVAVAPDGAMIDAATAAAAAAIADSDVAEMPLSDLLSTLRARTWYDLAQPFENGMPQSPSHVRFHMALSRRHGDTVREGGGSEASEVIVTGGHVGTHVDALSHVSQAGMLHGGRDAASTQTGGRMRELGADSIPPFIARGVLLDVARLRRVDVLAPGYAITPDDLERALAGTGTGLLPGDVVLVRTGWARHWGDPVAFVGHELGVPGVSVEAARWL
ncbi:MAG: hypothetical protein FJW96_13540, partial [Actinobacteria bacterium]|nr:hypothetical protein [Actinomycetota bacterium]